MKGEYTIKKKSGKSRAEGRRFQGQGKTKNLMLPVVHTGRGKPMGTTKALREKELTTNEERTRQAEALACWEKSALRLTLLRGNRDSKGKD